MVFLNAMIDLMKIIAVCKFNYCLLTISHLVIIFQNLFFFSDSEEKGELNLKTYPSDQIIKESEYITNNILNYPIKINCGCPNSKHTTFKTRNNLKFFT